MAERFPRSLKALASHLGAWRAVLPTGAPEIDPDGDRTPSGASVEPSSAPAGARLRLAVLFVQYDRKKYPGALERLLSLLERLTETEYEVLVLDNADPGDWEHSLSSRVVHVGGDNSGWEFSAFDKGLALLDRRADKPDVIVLSTDAFMAYGDEFLAMIDGDVLRQALSLDACVGWVDAWPERAELFEVEDRSWLRTSLLIAPARLLESVRPLCRPIPDERVFSDDPAEPFLPDAPLSDNLRRYLLEWLVGSGAEHLSEQWHSTFSLTAQTFDFFRAKVRAILREHVVSAGLRRSGISAFDLRLLRAMRVSDVRPDRIDAVELARHGWDSWRSFEEEAARRLSFRFHVDLIEIPRSVQHGDPLNLAVEGWALGARVPEFVQLRIGSERSAFALIDLERQDVLDHFPGYKQLTCGFRFEASITGLSPGVHDVVLSFEGAAEAKTVGQVRVSPAARFDLVRSAFPGTWPAGEPVPISLEGELHSSYRALTAKVLFDGELVEQGVLLGEGELVDDEMWTHRIWLNTQVWRKANDRTDHFPLEITLELERGIHHTWRKHLRIVAEDAPSHVHELKLGPYRPEAGLTDVRIEVDVFDARPGDSLVLCAGGNEVLDVPVGAEARRSGERPSRLTIERAVTGVVPGASEVTLALRRGGHSRRIWSGSRLIAHDRPEIRLEYLRVELVASNDAPAYRLAVRGWVENHFLVDCLLLEIGGSLAGVLGLHQLRPDVAEVHGNPMILRQGFDAVLELGSVSPGEHVVHLVATQRGAESARCSRRLEFDDLPHRQFSISSAELERIARGELTQFYSSIVIQGVARALSPDIVLSLLIDDKLADEQTFDEPGEHPFHLRAAPPTSGEYVVRFVVSHHGRLIYTTDARTVAFRKADFPAKTTTAIGRLLDRFDLRSRILGLADDRVLADRLIEAQPERVPEYLEMLATVSDRLQNESREGGRIAEPVVANLERRMRVLVATWETPSRYHGGGVYLTNMLAGLGRRHEITLIHTYGIDEIGHVDALRPHVHRIISIPRAYQPAAYRGAGIFPRSLYDGYIPELHRVIELEATSGDYDLIDYEYWPLGPYIVPGLPSVLTVHEMGYTALLNSAFRKARTLDAALPYVDQLIRTFYYDTCELPRLTPQLITLTPEDADALSRFNPEATVYTSPTGVDAGYFGEAAGPATDPADPPAVVFVGNFQHPPNAVAVTFFARDVMPILRRTYPDVEFHVIGSRVPPEVRDLDGQNGIRIVGFVDDLRPWLAGASAYVAPLFTGTGMRIKVLEALAAGVPLVATDLAVRGLPLEDGVHYMAANDATDFVRAVSFAIEQPVASRRLALRGASIVKERFSWAAAVQQRDDIWQSVVAMHREVSNVSRSRSTEEQLLA